MIINFKSVILNGRKYQHLPAEQRPCSYHVEVRDDDGNVFMFRSDGEAVTLRDWFHAEINGRRYTDSDAWNETPVCYIHDAPATSEPMPIFFAYGGDGPQVDDLTLLTEALNRVITQPVQFRRGEVVSVTI